jgi:hypothetical protein
MKRLLPIAAIAAAGFVSVALPPGEFGAYDVAVRAGICGVAAGLIALLLIAFAKRSERRESQ